MKAMQVLATVTLASLLIACGARSEEPSSVVPDDSPPPGGTVGPQLAATVDGGSAIPSACQSPPAGRVELPADDGPHTEATEWWYWTGHLRADDGRWFGFEWAFFLQEVLGVRGQMVHHAISDQSGGVFAYDVGFRPGPPAPVERGFALEVGAHSAVGVAGEDYLEGEVGVYELELVLSPVKPPVLQHGDGYTAYGFGGYTYYYSRPRMAARGTLTIDGEPLAVEGTAWFDHQWGSLSGAVDTGWDWFAIQLDDSREIMLFTVRADGSEALAGGTYTDAACQSAEIAPDELEVTPLGEWTSPHTGCTYPSGWAISVRDLELMVTPVMEDQEVDALVVRYWEGMAEVSGDSAGRAYVELNGYCRALPNR